MSYTATGIQLTDIENAIVDRVSGLFRQARVQAKGEGPVSLYPSLFCSTMSAAMERIGNNLKVKPLVYLIMKFKDLRKEEDRRRGIYPLVQGVITALWNQDLGLKIDVLRPTRLQDITDETDRQEGFIVFGLELTTGFVMNTVDDSALTATSFVSMGLNYFLLPDINSDATADASDDVELPQ